MDAKARLIRFYEKYSPDKLEDEDKLMQLLEKSKGKEEQLFAKLVDKYGPEPVATESVNAAVSEAKPSKQKKSKNVQEEEEEGEDDDAEKSSKKEKKKKKDEKKKKTKKSNKEEDGDENDDDDEGDTEERAKAQPPKQEEEEQQDDDGYGSRSWWRARLVRYYKAYQVQKTDVEIDTLLDKTNNEPSQLEKLFRMMEKKYGPEPDPSSSSSSEEEEDEEGNDGANNNNNDDDDANDEEDIVIPGLKNVMYCPVNGVAPELCEYFDSFKDCLPWLYAKCPELKLATKNNVTVAEFCRENNIEPLVGGIQASSMAKARKRGGQAKKGDGKIIIESQERRRKKITTIKGLESVEGVKLKDAAKQLGKKFACGASVKAAQSGEDMIEIQGDVAYDLPDILLEYYPAVKKSDVFIVDEDGKKRGAFD